MHAIRHALCARVVPVAVLLAAAIALGVSFAGSAAASPAYGVASAKPRPIPGTGWHGRPIRHPQQRVGHAFFADIRYPNGWRAGAVGFGAGYHSLHGSRRVREIQRRLTRLGYRTGPIDGLYGPLTRSAVQWFQIKHGLRPTGVVAAATLTVLRHPKAPPVTSSTPASLRNTPTPQPEPLALDRTASQATPAWVIPSLFAMLAGMLALVLLAATRARRTAFLRRRVAPAAEAVMPAPAPLPRWTLARPAPPPVAQATPVLGYVTSEDLRSGVPHEVAIREACKRRNWKLVHLARDSRVAGGRTLARPGLSDALAQLTAGRASRLVVHELRQLARSAGELRVVLSWFLHMGVPLTALDVDLDTGTAEGEKAARAILSVTAAEPLQGRSRPALTRGRGWGSVADRPELARRIRQMRASGLTLQAIADNLNDAGVPTVRGGARWRPSSVQSVLGYKRSRSSA
jgi:peptidoglycan hydrolase-like protein with peptidoglycan-binding domain/DNA invertase Pin-like site-specific DNA recombinase